MPFEIVALADVHVGDAVALWAATYRALRAAIPAAPARYAEPGAFLASIQELTASHGGVVALKRGRLVGYLTGFPIVFRGRRTFFSPEWANAVDPTAGANIVGALYSAASALWLDAGCYSHVVTALAHDRKVLDVWRWLGFGYCVADAIRELAPLNQDAVDAQICRGSLADVDAIVRLVTALDAHLAAPPIFLWSDDPLDVNDLRRELADPRMAYWLAWRNGRPIAYLRQGPASQDACDIIVDEGTTSIIGAYTEPDARRAGVASALLDRALAWGREQGYTRCAVDFETMNVPGARFWLRYFQPITVALCRMIDDRVPSAPSPSASR
jgi:GNAT superfamily N-acetyltransferase